MPEKSKIEKSSPNCPNDPIVEAYYGCLVNDGVIQTPHGSVTVAELIDPSLRKCRGCGIMFTPSKKYGPATAAYYRCSNCHGLFNLRFF